MDGCYDMAEQVLFDILLFLPVMSLLRFKAVCKNWCSLIESSSFISEHVNHNRDNKDDNFIIFSNVCGSNFRSKRKFALLSGREYEECVYDIDIGQFWHPANDVFPSGYCDGIVCLTYGGNKVALWNPALKQVRHLPQSSFSDRLLSSKDYKCLSSKTSFGIDVKNNDYKLVRILIFAENYKNLVEVYNLGGDDSWRIIHEGDGLPFLGIHTNAAISSTKTGKCFWIASRYDFPLDDDTPILLSFDFNDDVFGTMLLPNKYKVRYCDLDFLDDKVVYFKEEIYVDFDMNMEIWILHEFGVETSWNLIYKFGPMSYLDIFYPRRISKNGEFLICGKLRGERLGEDIFYLYNLHTQQGKYHQKCNLVLCAAQLTPYNASLLSLRSANGPTY